MNVREWKKLTIYSVVLLLVGLLCCQAVTGSVTKQGVEASAHEKKTKEKETVVTYAKPSTEEMVFSRSNSYIEIARTQVATGCAVYLENDPMEFTITMTITGTAAGSVTKDSVVSIMNGTKQSVNDKKSACFKKMVIKDRNSRDASQNEIQLILKMKKQYEPVLYETESAYYISLLESRKAFEKIVVLDAGHGGMDEGTSSSDWKEQEKEYTLRIAKKVKTILSEQNIKVYMTRDKDIATTKASRVALANATKADLFVSIHCNASDAGDTVSQGVECLYATKKKKLAKQNQQLAKIVLQSLVKTTGQKKRGVIKRNGLYILRYAKVPATIVEVGYMSNKKDLKKIIKESGQDAIAKGISDGILRALEVNE